MDISVYWSSDLSALAMSLQECWKTVNRKSDNPFTKIAVVINDPATEKWLKQYLLMECQMPLVMMNLEFVMLPEFVNDWLWTVRGKPLRERQASLHPYSRNILAWRIYRILADAPPNIELDELLKYVNTGDKTKAPTRRYALAAKLATLYDDYLNSRFMMLRKWEVESLPNDPEVPKWQVELYNALWKENQETYAKEYEEALREGTDAAKAFEYGFPRYLAAFVFDVPFISKPALSLLEKMSEALPMTFWNFNPKDDWLAETPSEKEVKRRLRESIRKCLDRHNAELEAGGHPNSKEMEIDVSQFYDLPEERLLGAMASGARGVIGALCDDSGGNIEIPATDKEDAFKRLQDKSISIHSVYSRRRELEAIKDGLHDFLKKTNAAPHEALVLCADWATYAPIIESVFPPDSSHDGYIPISTEPMQGNTPIMESFDNLLKFRNNRFEVSAVFALLDLPEIRERYGLNEASVEALHDMVKKANIHWGLDDDDIKGILDNAEPVGQETSESYPFSWQRGLDRLTAELLFGFTDDCSLLDVGIIKQLHPCGHVEGERAESVAALWALVEDLATLRRVTLPKGRCGTAAELKTALLDMLKIFYVENDSNLHEFNEIRKAIITVAESAERAMGQTADIQADVFIKAVQEAIRKRLPGRRNSADTVQFAPLNTYTATPHRFIWICGLNSDFPSSERRASYDMIGRHPSLFDATSRERDAFALLKATLCSGESLNFSYVGKEMRSNEKIPPSVLLDNLMDYFKAKSITPVHYSHPLQGYSQRYFHKASQAEDKLPPTYSKTNEEIEKALAGEHGQARQLIAFPLKEHDMTEIPLDDLVDFFSHPHRYLFKKRLNAVTPWFDDFEDSECLEARLDKALKKKLALGKATDSPAILSVETGNAPDTLSAEQAMQKIKRLPIDQVEDFENFENEKPEEKTIPLTVNGKEVTLTGSYRTIEKNGARQAFLFVNNKKYAENEILIRHLAANAAFENGVTTIALSPEEDPAMENRCPADEARQKLTKLLELATSPLPSEYPSFSLTNPKDDKIPNGWMEEIQ